MAITKKNCADYGNLLREQTEKFYNPRISELEKIIQEKQAEGVDPSNVKLLEGAVTMNYFILLEKVKEARQQALDDANLKEKNCQDDAVPDWVGDAELAVSIALVIVMLPFVVLTQSYAVMHIDLGEVYKGRLLGGDNALIPKVRTEALDALQIGGDVRKFLENPVVETGGAITGIAKEIVKAIEDFFRKPFG